MREGYKESPFGTIPEEWETVTVREATLEHKQGYYTKEEYCSEGIKLVRITDLGNPNVNFNTMPSLNIAEKDYHDFKIEKGDFLFARSGAIGRYGIVEQDPEPAIFASYLIRFKFNQEYLINRYFGYFFESSFCKGQLASIAQGNANININAENIKSLKVPLPPLPEQQKIAEVLSTVDAKIEVIGEQIEQTQELKKGLMQRLLTKGIGHTQFKDSPLGQIPESWEVVTLKSLGNVVTGSTPSTKVKEFYSEEGTGYMWASPADLGSYKYVKRTNKYLTEIGFAQTRQLPANSILVTCIGSTIGKIGMATASMATNQQINSLICSKDNSPDFYYYVLESLAPYIKSLAGTQAVPLLNKTDFSNILLAKPSLPEQQSIASVLSTVDEKLDVLYDKKEQYQELKKGLMQQLLTGKLRVNHLIEQTEMA